MSLQKDIPELVREKVISEETAQRIDEYYKIKNIDSPNKLLIVFGILGSILIGLGLILIIAHNWDELSRFTKTIIAFLPLITGQIICLYTLIKKPESTALRESSTAFLFLAVGTCVSLISQIYNISGDLSSFILTWMLICLPLMFVMRSSAASLLFISGITYFAVLTGYNSHTPAEYYLYWLMFLTELVYYFLLYKRNPAGNFMVIHNWLIPYSLVITLATISENHTDLIFIAYISLFGLFYLIGNTSFFKNQRPWNQGYTILGNIGTISLLMALSFDWFWEELRRTSFKISEVLISSEFIACVIITIPALILLYTQIRKKSLLNIKPIEPVFVIFILIFIAGMYSEISAVYINILILAVSILTIRHGEKTGHLGILNYGLLIITTLIICRFFDTDLSFVVRGILFVIVGAGFFFANYLMLKKRRKVE